MSAAEYIELEAQVKSYAMAFITEFDTEDQSFYDLYQYACQVWDNLTEPYKAYAILNSDLCPSNIRDEVLKVFPDNRTKPHIVLSHDWDYEDWAIAHYHIAAVVDAHREYTVPGDVVTPIVLDVEGEHGISGVTEFVANLANKFLKDHPTDTVGEGEWPDKLEAFIDVEVFGEGVA